MQLVKLVFCFLLSFGVMFSSTSYAKRSAKPATTHQAIIKKSTKVNLNTADATTLAKQVNGFGPKRAEAIVKYREANGPFKSFDELVKVKGIGKKFMAKKRPHLEEVLTLS